MPDSEGGGESSSSRRNSDGAALQLVLAGNAAGHRREEGRELRKAGFRLLSVQYINTAQVRTESFDLWGWEEHASMFKWVSC